MIVLLSVLSALITFFITQKIDSIRASIISTLILSAVVYCVFPGQIEEYLYVIYGASFVGMTHHRLLGYRWITVGACLYSFGYLYLKALMLQVGGVLGFMAFLCVCCTYILYMFAQKLKKI